MRQSVIIGEKIGLAQVYRHLAHRSRRREIYPDGCHAKRTTHGMGFASSGRRSYRPHKAGNFDCIRADRSANERKIFRVDYKNRWPDKNVYVRRSRRHPT